ncbi:3'-5' exonuclease [Amaricoccus macauensis]|uniref:3'-5' exonuclease n=1 Tax=Amaricoccus macauensis TaxID=57001 RepID=UPI003C7BAA8A
MFFTPKIAQNFPRGSFRFVALDVETANSDPSSICQIGLACVDAEGGIEVWSTLVDPKQRFSSFNVQIHGIDAEMVRGAPQFAEVLRRIEPLLDRHFIIQHSGFDRRAIRSACAVIGQDEPLWSWGDSVKIARRAWPEFKGSGGHGLAHLKRALDLEFDHHDAGEDAKAAAMVVLLAETRTGLSYGQILDGAGGREMRTASSARIVRGPDVVPHLSRLDGLVRFLMDAPVPTVGTVNVRRGVPRRRSGAIKVTENDFDAHLERVESECRSYFENGVAPSPHCAWRIAVILRKARQAEHERAFLEGWCRHFATENGRVYSDLVERARRLNVVVRSAQELT